MPFKMHKIRFFPEKNVCLPYLKFSDLLPEILIFYLALFKPSSFFFWREGEVGGGGLLESPFMLCSALGFLKSQTTMK